MDSERSSELIAIIGGMGAAAGVKLQELVVQRRHAKRDRDHVPLLAYTNPRVPPRIGEKGHECVGEIIRTIQVMEKAGATRYVIACNTAHIYAKEIQAGVSIPMLSLVECTATHICNVLGDSTCIGILGTRSLMDSEVFQKALLETMSTLNILTPKPAEQKRLDEIIQGQDGLKGGNIGAHIQEEVKSLAMTLVERGASAILTACTELPLVLSVDKCPLFPVKLIDPMAVIADEIIRLSLPVYTNGSNGST